MSKAKGSRTERELLHKFWEHKWYCIRIAGSGSMPFPCPDLLAGKHGKSLAIECKSSKGTQRRYLSVEQLRDLQEYARGFGAEAWIGVRFNGLPWFFLKPHHLGKSSGERPYLDKELALRRGISFEQLIGQS